MTMLSDRLIKLTQNIFCLKGPTNTGVISLPKKDGSSHIYLIDSGNDDAQALTILECITHSFEKTVLKAVINTHSHADHCGGNSFLKEKTSCQLWASTGEAAIMDCPVIEAGLIWGGMPVQEMNTPYFVAKPCSIDKTFKNDESFILENTIEVQAVSLKGHYIDQTGFLVTDTDGKKVFFAGDALSGRNVIKKYWIQYLFDEELSKQSLKIISGIKADFYVPGHGDYVSEIEGLVELNQLALLETENLILDELKEPKTLEQLLKNTADRNEIKMHLTQYSLIGCTLRSYLSALCNAGKIRYEIKDNIMYWSAI